MPFSNLRAHLSTDRNGGEKETISLESSGAVYTYMYTASKKWHNAVASIVVFTLAIPYFARQSGYRDTSGAKFKFRIRSALYLILPRLHFRLSAFSIA